MEWSFPQPLQRRDGELCAHPSAPTSSLSMELDDTNSKLTNATRTSTAAQSFSQVPHLYTSAPDSTPLPTSEEASQGSIGKTKKCSKEFDQCDLPGTTSRSHFLIPRSKQNKYGDVGKRAQPIYHNVLRPKSAICRVRHALD
nr:hypothetical protein CFP56_18921 [Quercus suber]